MWLAAKESEDRFSAMANAIPHLAWIAHPGGYTHWYNRHWYEYTGTTLQEVQGWGWRCVHDPKSSKASKRDSLPIWSIW